MKVFLIAAAACWIAGPALSATLSRADEAALRALAQAADDAWNGRDAERMASHYTADASLMVGGTGGERQGRSQVRDYFQRAFTARQGDLRHVSEITGLQLISPDLAFNDVAVKVEARQPDGSWRLVRRFNNVSVAVREDGTWRLRAVRAYPES